MQFRVNISHNATDEAGMLTWLTFIRDNYGASVIDGSVQSNNLMCNVTIVLPTLNEAVNAIIAFHNNFDIQYGLAVVV